MGARFQSFWQHIKRHPIATGVLGIILVVVIILIIVEFKLYGTGFPGKTLWDWLQLLIVPLVLAIIALVFQLANKQPHRKAHRT